MKNSIISLEKEYDALIWDDNYSEMKHFCGDSCVISYETCEIDDYFLLKIIDSIRDKEVVVPLGAYVIRISEGKYTYIEHEMFKDFFTEKKERGILNHNSIDIDKECLLRNKYSKDISDKSYIVIKTQNDMDDINTINADKIKNANEVLVSLMQSVALGDTRQQEYIDVFGPIVKYATKCFKTTGSITKEDFDINNTNNLNTIKYTDNLKPNKFFDELEKIDHDIHNIEVPHEYIDLLKGHVCMFNKLIFSSFLPDKLNHDYADYTLKKNYNKIIDENVQQISNKIDEDIIDEILNNSNK